MRRYTQNAENTHTDVYVNMFAHTRAVAARGSVSQPRTDNFNNWKRHFCDVHTDHCWFFGHTVWIILEVVILVLGSYLWPCKLRGEADRKRPFTPLSSPSCGTLCCWQIPDRFEPLTCRCFSCVKSLWILSAQTDEPGIWWKPSAQTWAYLQTEECWLVCSLPCVLCLSVFSHKLAAWHACSRCPSGICCVNKHGKSSSTAWHSHSHTYPPFLQPVSPTVFSLMPAVVCTAAAGA